LGWAEKYSSRVVEESPAAYRTRILGQAPHRRQRGKRIVENQNLNQGRRAADEATIKSDKFSDHPKAAISQKQQASSDNQTISFAA